jgi:hypothetical protein
MARRIKRPRSGLGRKADLGFRGYPLATVAFYGPTASRATKVAIFKLMREDGEPELMDRWVVDKGDVRSDLTFQARIGALLSVHQIVSVTMLDRIIGCPHEEGVDYPDGQSCPQCAFWSGRDRFTHELLS